MKTFKIKFLGILAISTFALSSCQNTSDSTTSSPVDSIPPVPQVEGDASRYNLNQTDTMVIRPDTNDVNTVNP